MSMQAAGLYPQGVGDALLDPAVHCEHWWAWFAAQDRPLIRACGPANLYIWHLANEMGFRPSQRATIDVGAIVRAIVDELGIPQGKTINGVIGRAVKQGCDPLAAKATLQSIIDSEH